MIKLKTFAVLKDMIGDEIEVESSFEKITDLKTYLLAKYPDIQSLIHSCRFAVDMKFVEDDFKISDQTLICVIPPSSGG